MAWDSGKLAYWGAHYKSWQLSGLTQSAYCTREAVSLSAFTRWNKRARSGGIVQKEGAAAPATDQTLTLVPLRIVDTCSQDHFVLRSNSGWQLQLPTTVKADWLIDLLKRLP